MLGEARAAERPQNSLLNVHLDFNTATKVPPTITKETTTAIDALIKQRVLDELFDDPILKEGGGQKRRKLDESQVDFTKSKKGLGDLYADDLHRKLMNRNQDAFLESELSGPDGPLKREVEEIAKDLFANLEILSNFHYTPKAPQAENQIQTQNVPALMLEEGLPISVSTAQTRSAREVFTATEKSMRDRAELTKEERRKERASKKRKIKAGQHAKSNSIKEHRR